MHDDRPCHSTHLTLQAVFIFSLTLSPVFGQGYSPSSASTSDTLVCYRTASATRVMGTPNSPVSFAANVALDLRLKNEIGDLDENKTAILAQHVERAMVLWRSACTHCVGGNATVVYVNGKRYLDSQLANYLRAVNMSNVSDAPPPTPTPEQLEEWKHRTPVFKVGPEQPNTSTQGTSPPPPPNRPQENAVYPYSVEVSMLSQHQTPASVMAKYEVVPDSDVAYAKTCAADPQKLPPLLKDVQAAFRCHGEGTTTVKAAQLTVYILNHFTSCGANRNIIGCSADDLVIELNAQDYKFVSHTDGEVLFGSAGPEVDLLHVLTHEVGHWMGLPHLDTSGNMMADSLSSSKCIDDSDVVALDSQVITEATRRKGKGAFYYLKEVKKSF